MTRTSLRVQKTIRKSGSLSGVGLHSGKKVTMRFEPAGVGFGVRFFNKGKEIPKEVINTSRCTIIGDKESSLQTVEHLLAAISGLEITNLRIEADSTEVPAMDGSAIEFVRLFKALGIQEQTEPVQTLKIKEPIFCGEKGKALAAIPDEKFSIAYTLDYPHPFLREQIVDFDITADIFEKEIASARTFCTSVEAEEVRKRGLGLGANHKNTLVIGESGPIENQFRYPDECARHKVLDMMGDLSLLGFPLQVRVIGIRSGHTLNQQLVERIKEQQGR